MSRSAPVATRRSDRRPEQTIRKLLDAGTEELRVSSYSGLTMRTVAARAGVSPASAYTYFPSKNALVAKLYLEVLRTVGVHVDVNESPKSRVSATLREMAMAGSDDPELTAACATALMADDPAVDAVRADIAIEVAQRIKAALGPGWAPAVRSTLELTFSGALMSARFLTFEQIAERMDSAIDLILGASVA